MTKTIDALVEALEAYERAGFGNSTDFAKQGEAYDKAVEALAQARAEQAEPQPEQDGPIVDGWQLSVADGHSGHGVYAHMTEYPDEGAVLVLPITPRAEQAEPVAFVSPLQFEQRLVDPDGEFGTYIPMRKTSAGKFTQPLYTTLPAAPVAKLEPVGIVESLHELNDRWLSKLPIGTALYTVAPAKPGPCATCESLARAVMLDQTGIA